MKRNRFIVTLVAMVMSMLLVQGALAADEELDELLASIEADGAAAVDDLVNSFATDDTSAYQLRATLESANATKLAEIIQNADSLEDVSAILAGTEGVLALGDLDKDYVFTPVTPCRLVDTRIVGGPLVPNERREYFVYGAVGGQGGAANCPSPRGEPRGVHINVVAVPVSFQGNFRLYPANIGPPTAGLLNYKAGVQNIANAGTFKTFFSLGAREIEIQNRVGTAHLVIDVMGYYHDVNEDEFKVRTAAKMCGRSPNLVTGSLCTNSNCNQLSINVPGPGKIFVDAKLVIELLSHTQGTGDYVEVFIASTPTECYSSFPDAFLAMDWGVPANTPSWGSGLSFDYMAQPISLNRVFTVTGSGTKTYYLNTERFSGTGIMRMRGSLMRAFYYPDF